MGVQFLTYVTFLLMVIRFSQEQVSTTACTFQRYTDSYFGGGFLDGSKNSDSECKADCDIDVRCLAYDYEIFSRFCFIHHDNDQLSQLYSSPGWILSIKTCSCNDTYIPTTDTSAFGGVLRINLTSSSACQDACSQLPITQCGGFDFNTASKQCFHQANTNPGTFKNPMVIHYSRNFCQANPSIGCTDTFSVTYGKGGASGYQQNTIYDGYNCRAYCLSQDYSQCSSYDFNNNDHSCWFFNKTSVTMYDNPDSTHYTRVKCQLNACVDSFQASDPKVATLDGQLQSASTLNYTDCQGLCLQAPTNVCASIDYNSKDKTCYFFNVTNGLIRYTNPDVQHYTRIPCGQGANTSACVSTFNSTLDVAGYGGTQVNGVLKFEECRDTCTNNPNCTAFDFLNTSFVTQRGCWTFNVPADSIDLYTPLTLGILTHYVKQPCQGNFTVVTQGTTTKTCIDYFNSQLGVGYNGGVGQVDQTIFTTSQCQQRCLSQMGCTGFDLTTAGLCFIFTVIPTVSYNSSSVNHYTRVPCDLSVTTASTTSTVCGSFVEFKGKGTYGGTLSVPGSGSVINCKNMCLSTSCKSIDFTNDNWCYLNYQDNPGTYNSQTVRRFVIIPCTSPGVVTTQSTTAKSTTPVPVPLTTRQPATTTVTVQTTTIIPATSTQSPTTIQPTTMPTSSPTVPTTSPAQKTTTSPFRGGQGNNSG